MTDTRRPRTAVATLVEILRTPTPPNGSNAIAEARLIAGEALAQHLPDVIELAKARQGEGAQATVDDLFDQHASTVTGLTEIVAHSTLVAHRARAAAALLRLGVNALPEVGP